MLVKKGGDAREVQLDNLWFFKKTKTHSFPSLFHNKFG